MNMQNLKIKILALDLQGCLYLNHFSQFSKVSLFFKWVSRLGDGWFWAAMLLLTALMQAWQSVLPVLYILITTLFSTTVYKLLKRKTVRPRPYQVHQVIVLGERPLDHFSFPSGHTQHAVMFSCILGAIEPLLLILMLPFTLLVGLSRMVLGLHYPSDVLMGATLGVCIAGLSLWLAPIYAIQL
ncbi:phosphatase PAP2 family protein [Acinetobacter sp. MD2(2019)]|uniref:phosphatase PAP2 family protein n=1 Tax=Acinetobacter sp. MD2(2019) TaxID=2605273 RepID=UPI002D1E7D8D|nr:phosphatase PAP2 family protein [Acinetobacter sp. MD2(2019)]MEB3753589.1 phosphatase PAP2 family protein [Acinetobacter sp. MD2(2019)]